MVSMGHIRTFQALIARQKEDRIDTAVEELDISELPPGEILVKVLRLKAVMDSMNLWRAPQ